MVFGMSYFKMSNKSKMYNLGFPNVGFREQSAPVFLHLFDFYFFAQEKQMKCTIRRPDVIYFIA